MNNGSSFWSTAEGRIISIENRQYLIHVRTLVISKKLHVFLEIKELEQKITE